MADKVLTDADGVTYRIGPGAHYYNGFTWSVSERYSQQQYRALRTGAIPRASRCMVCGQTAGDLTEHLEDYRAPLDYLPLCYPCHTTLHGRYTRREQFDRYYDMVENGWRALPFDKHDWHQYRRLYIDQPTADWPGSTGHRGEVDMTLFSLLPPLYTNYVPEHFDMIAGAPMLVGQWSSAVARTVTASDDGRGPVQGTLC